jgi:hypothetical protein
MRCNVNKEVRVTSEQLTIFYVHTVLFTQSVVVPWSQSRFITSIVLMYTPQPRSHDCSNCTSGDSDVGCDRQLHPHSHCVVVLSGTSMDISYFKVKRIKMAMRIEEERNRNQLTTGHSCTRVCCGPSTAHLSYLTNTVWSIHTFP